MKKKEIFSAHYRDVNLSDFFIKSNFKGARANLKTTF